MRIVVISDTHGEHRKLDLPEGEMIIHAGDFCHNGNNMHVKDFLNWFEELNFDTKILVAGNHDFLPFEEPKRFKEILPEGINYLNDNGLEKQGLKIWGSPVQPGLVGWAFGKPRGKAMKHHWDLIPGDVDILITHTPPKGILDKTSAGVRLGCEELKKRLKQLSPKIHLFGHIHNSYGAIEINGVVYVNASNMNSAKGLVNKAKVFDVSK